MSKEKMITAYQLKITLRYTKPPIWRRVVVPATIRLDELHNIIIIAMGWKDSHLHTFKANGVTYGVPDPDWFEEVKDEAKFSLNQILQTEKQKIFHHYDFGDGWEHTITLEKIIPGNTTLKAPHCLTGKRACPPEDCGGIPGFYHFVEIVCDPHHPQYDFMIDWFGDFEPSYLDIDAINAKLSLLR